ncbi:MAG: FtsH protease activity modulator HflK [Litorimonas sp.]
MSDSNSPWGPKPGSGNNGGKGEGNSPWGNGGGQRPNKPQRPNRDNVIEGFKARTGRGGGSGGGSGNAQLPEFNIPPWLFVLVPLVLLASTSIFTVQGNQQAAILRFGDYVRTAGPGLNFKLPYPIETKIVEDVTDQREITVGINDDESLMITGDENIVDLEFKVLYVIKPEGGLSDFLFEIEDPNETVKATAESVVREVIGMNDLDKIITTERAQLIATVRMQLQSLLDEYQAGVEVVDVQFQKTDPPEGAVLEAFDRVVASAQEAEAEVNNARAEFNKVTLEAEGRAAAILQEAEAYRDQVIAISEGEAERFLAVYEEYEKAPEVTRRRIYLETLEEVYRDADKVILDGEAGGGAVPYLPLNELNRGGSQ